MVCGSIVWAAVLSECEPGVPKVPLFTAPESATVTPVLAALVDIGTWPSPVVVTGDGACCIDIPAALEKKGAPVCTRGISCVPVVATC